MNSPQKKHIVYVENGIGYGGAAICMRHLVRNLDHTQFDSMVVTGRTGASYEEIAHETQWKYIPDHRFDTIKMKESLEKNQWINKIPGLSFISNQLIARLDDLGNFLPFTIQLLWTCKQFKADLIHANNEAVCNRASILVGKILHIPVISHVRGDLDGTSQMTRWIYQKPTHFIPVSHWVSKNIAQFDIPQSKRTVIYDGLELDNLDVQADGHIFRNKLNLHEKNFVVGLVGLIIPWKGQDIFLDAAKILHKKIPQLKMLLVGGTPDVCTNFEKHLKQRIEQEELGDFIIFTGHQSDMNVVYNGLDVVVSASTSPEPLGTVVIESMALGRPLVAPNHGGAAEMADHNETALLFEPGNAESLAGAIFSFYSNKDLREKLGKAARTIALKTFAVESHVQNVQKVYKQYL